MKYLALTRLSRSRFASTSGHCQRYRIAVDYLLIKNSEKKGKNKKKNAECLTLGKRLNVSIKFNRHATLINIFIYFLFARRLLFAAINAFEALNAFKSFYVWSKVILVQFLESKTVNGKFMRI